MKKWALLLLVIFGVAIVKGEVIVNVYEADGVTPFVDRDIMVGTKLTIIVSSDNDGYWSGGLFITGQDRALAELTARGWDPDTQDWMSSRYDTAGENALVWDYYDSLMWGFDLYTDSNAVAGDWFVIDYTAMEIGDPNVGFYDYNVSWDDAISLMYFSHIPTRDFNEDKIVNLVDYDLLASHWLAMDCIDPCWCGQTDINTDGKVDFGDLILFTEYWLWTAPDWVLIADFSENTSSMPMTTSEMPEVQESETYQPTQELSTSEQIEVTEKLLSDGTKIEFLAYSTGESLARIVTDPQGNMTHFILYLNDGNRVELNCTYDSMGNETSAIYTHYDADGNIILVEYMEEDMLL